MEAWPKTYLNVFSLTLTPILALTLILKHKNLFGKTKWLTFWASVEIPLLTKALAKLTTEERIILTSAYCWSIFLKLVKYILPLSGRWWWSSIWVRNRRPCFEELATWPNACKWHLDVPYLYEVLLYVCFQI